MIVSISSIRFLSLLMLPLAIGSGVAAQQRTAPDPRSTVAPEQSKIADRVHRLVNQFRQQQGLAPLALDAVISAEAREHSAEMARNGNRIGHRDFKQRVEDIGARIRYRAAAENVAVNAGYDDPAAAAVEGWKKSPEHRKNMLGDFNLTGIGVTRGEDDRYFFTQIFIRTAK